MDIIGALGYHGQEIVFADTELLAYVTGKSVCVVDVGVGPREMIWRPNSGIRKIASHVDSSRLALIPALPGFHIEVLSFPDQLLIAVLQNPTETAIIEIAFSRNGDRLCALSESMEQKAIAWDVNSQKILFTFDLSYNFLYCSFNPADSDQILLYGNEGIGVGVVNEIVDIYSFKIRMIETETEKELSKEKSQSIDSDKVKSAAFSDFLNQMQFVIWSSINKFLVGVRSSKIFEVDSLTLSVKKLGNLLPESDQNETIFPVSAALSIENLIVGFSNGKIYWYPMPIDSSLDGQTLRASQIGTARGVITTLVIDPKFELVIAGTSLGIISKLPVAVMKLKSTEGDEDDMASIRPDVHAQVPVKGKTLCVYQDGAVLCSTALALPIIGISASKIAKKSTNLLQTLVTGSHLGRITFWKQPSTDSEPIGFNQIGIRRSIPRALNVLNSINVVEDGQETACTFCTMPSSIKDGSCLLGVGLSSGAFISYRCLVISYNFSSGWLEILKIEAVECDDDEEEGESGDETGLSDEDGVKLFVKRLSRQRFFYGSLSLMCPASDWDEKPDIKLVAIASLDDNRIIVLKDNGKESFEAILTLPMGMYSEPTSLCWMSSGLCVCTHAGIFCIMNNQNISRASVDIFD
jgi:hypothetical protein